MTKNGLRKKIGLALGSGGARGYSHIGVIKVLEKYKIPIDYISGSSIGAVVGAYYALNKEVISLEKIGMKMTKKDILSLVDINDPRVSIVKGVKVRSYLQKLLQNKTFSDTKIPLRIAATSLDDGSLITFKSGNLIDAVMASATFPGVFPVFEYKGMHLIDGGLSDGLPINLLKEMGADIIIGVDLYGFSNVGPKKYNTKDVLERTIKLLISKLSEISAKEYGNEVIVLKPRTGDAFETFSFDKAAKNINAGVVEAEKNIQKIKLLVNS